MFLGGIAQYPELPERLARSGPVTRGSVPLNTIVLQRIRDSGLLTEWQDLFSPVGWVASPIAVEQVILSKSRPVDCLVWLSIAKTNK